jgi:hypothetical protein
MYQLPDATRVELDLAPVLESWNAADHPDQIRLGKFLDHVEAALALSGRDEHLALELQVGISESRSLTSGGADLDNYLFPIIRRLGFARFDAVFASKRHCAVSTLAVGAARPVPAHREPDMWVRTTASATSKAWKEQVRNACTAAAPPFPLSGAVVLDIEFGVSPARTWATVWKPAIDSLGPVLGLPDHNRPFTPNDDRIVRLSLHRRLNESLRWDIELSVWWTTAVG